MKTGLLVLLAVLLFGGGAYGYFWYQQKTNSEIKSISTSDTSQVTVMASSDSLPQSPTDSDAAVTLAFRFENGLVTPKDYVIQNGHPILFHLESVDQDYDMSVPGWGVDIHVPAGQTVEQKIDRQGMGRQALFCGNNCFAVIQVDAERDPDEQE